MKTRTLPYIAPSLFVIVAAACGGGDKGSEDAGTDSGSDSGSGGTDPGGTLDLGGASSGSGATGGSSVCEKVESEAELKPVYLAFAFDVSGSMGKLDRPNWWHDPTKKWTPVVEATTAFFEDEESSGLKASLSLFPKSDDECDDASYETPEVPFSNLPSTSFAETLSAYETEVGSPLTGGDWRGGTPTQAAIAGTRTMIDLAKADAPNARFVIVLVTDGLPASCDNVDVDSVSAEVAEAAADGLSTYVIGVENPTVPPSVLPSGWADWGCGTDDNEPCDPPANLAALNQVAVSGGTDAAFLIDTGDPAATKSAFLEAIAAIRGKAVSCDVDIPNHPVTGVPFDKDFISPAIAVDGSSEALRYDAACKGDDTWHYDDDEKPTKIVLCPKTCGTLQGTSGASLEIEFLCEPRPDVIR